MPTEEGEWVSPAVRVFLLGVDLDEDGVREYVAVQLFEHPDIGEDGYVFHAAVHFYLDGEGWRQRTLTLAGPADAAGLYRSLDEGTLELRTPRFRDLSIGAIELETR